jgi:vacuolar-type H+-ATPase subunit I/STV1
MVKAVITPDELTDELKPLYKEDNGKYILNVEPVEGYALEDITGLKNTLSSERKKREELETKYYDLKDIDPKAALEALQKIEEMESYDPEKDADKIAGVKVEALKKQLVEKHTKELTEKEEKLGKLSSKLESLLIDSAAAQALSEAKGSVALLLPHIKSQTRVREVEGDYVVEILDKDGNVRIGNKDGDNMTIGELIEEMKASDVYARAFEGANQSGSGYNGNRSGAFGIPVNKSAKVDANFIAHMRNKI